MLKSTGNFFLFTEVTVIFEDVVNSIDFPHVAVCPFFVELFGLEQCGHVLLLCFDGERGVNSGAACVDVLAFEVWVSACLEHYLPECFLISHNGDQYIRIFLKVNSLFQLFLFFLEAVDLILLALVADRSEVMLIAPLPYADEAFPIALGSVLSATLLADQLFVFF
mgnify:FL=1